MLSFHDRAAALEALYIAGVEAAKVDRIWRVRRLGAWAARLMHLTPLQEERYQELLYRLGQASEGDRVLAERVRGDLVAAGVPLPLATVGEVLAAETDTDAETETDSTG